jgi:hypothetical protein
MAANQCPNGHLIFHTLNGSGCWKKDCPYSVNPAAKVKA